MAALFTLDVNAVQNATGLTLEQKAVLRGIVDTLNAAFDESALEADLVKITGITNGTQAANKAVVADTNVNTGISKVTQLHIGVSGSETQVTAGAAELNLAASASPVNNVASKFAMLDASKRVPTSANIGTAEANVTAVHVGDGVNNTAILSLANVPVTVGNSENLGVGALIYTLPAGACMIRDAYMSVALTGVTITNDTPELGIGTVIASGAVTALDGTATFEDIITGQAMADTNGTAKVKAAGPTAGNPLEIATAAAHTVHVNLADGWGANTDAAGVLNGTVVISYVRQAA